MSTLPDPISAIAQSRIPCSALASAPVLATIAAVRPGVWLVRSSDDRFGGTFVCPRVALKFVRDEATVLRRAVIVAVDGSE